MRKAKKKKKLMMVFRYFVTPKRFDKSKPAQLSKLIGDMQSIENILVFIFFFSIYILIIIGAAH
jgi:hypothetical protein